MNEWNEFKVWAKKIDKQVEQEVREKTDEIIKEIDNLLELLYADIAMLERLKK